MRDGFEAEGERWRVTAEDDGEQGVRTFVFHCLSNSSRPYRVVQVPGNVVSTASVDDLKEAELSELFSRSHTMDYVHDADAHPQGHGVDFDA